MNQPEMPSCLASLFQWRYPCAPRFSHITATFPKAEGVLGREQSVMEERSRGRCQDQRMGGGAGCTAGPRGEAEECPNYSTIMRTGSSPLPSAKGTRVGMRHRTVFPREKTTILAWLLNGYKWVSSAALRQPVHAKTPLPGCLRGFGAAGDPREAVMSFSRRNWSDLSSLARQRTLEDEEEQQRERRRRHRNLLSSSSVDEDHPSPGKDPSPAPSRPQAPVKLMAPEEGEERKLTEVLRTKEGRRMRSTMAVPEKPKQEKEQQEAGMKPHTGQESIAAAERGQDTAPAPAGEQHPEQSHGRKVTARGRLQDREGSGVGTLRGEQRREEEQQRVAPELGGCRLREVKILTRTRSSSTEEKAASEGTSPPAQQQPPRNPSKEGMQPPPSQEEPTEKRDAPPAPATYSTSIRRSSPRTVSFRVISNKQKEESESPLARSASMRIPGSSSSIEEKLEKYTSAVQRSGSVRSSLTVQKSLMLTSEGVASKRNFFEASAPSKAEPLAARKDNLKIPGSVTSRINLWISRTQEPAKEEKSKDIRKINSLPRRDGWVKPPRESPANPEL